MMTIYLLVPFGTRERDMLGICYNHKVTQVKRMMIDGFCLPLQNLPYETSQPSTNLVSCIYEVPETSMGCKTLVCAIYERHFARYATTGTILHSCTISFPEPRSFRPAIHGAGQKDRGLRIENDLTHHASPRIRNIYYVI